MLVHRLKKAVGVHLAMPIYFRPATRKNPADPKAVYKTQVVADQLGVNRQDVHALVKSGVLKADHNDRGDLVISGRELDRFVSKDLEPVEIAEVAPAPAPAAAAPTTAPPAAAATSVAKPKPSSVQPRKPDVVDLDASEAPASEEPDDEPELVDVDCPTCHHTIQVEEGVLAGLCPCCKARLAFAWPDDGQGGEDDQDEPAASAEPGLLRRLWAPRLATTH